MSIKEKFYKIKIVARNAEDPISSFIYSKINSSFGFPITL